LVAGCWLLVAGYWLLVAGCWLLVTGCWRFSKLLDRHCEGFAGAEGRKNLWQSISQEQNSSTLSCCPLFF
ncbi:MAG: hypothetical protein ACNS62_18680, partial [Candidatus Cyclobacteriaceae bacterium M3_2C_046]